MSSERFTSLPSPVESVESLDSTTTTKSEGDLGAGAGARAGTGAGAGAEAGDEASVEEAPATVSATASGTATESITNKGDVMITLSLPSQPLTSPRTRSPLARSHFRSRSLAGVPSVPPMTRAYSSPGLDSRGRYIFANGRGALTSNKDTLENGAKRHHPLLQVTPGDEDLEARMAPLTIAEPIAEHAETDTAVKPSYSSSFSQADVEPGARTGSPAMSTHHTLPRMGRRRPSSPLPSHPGGNNPGGQVMGSPLSAHSSPMTLSSKYNESFPAYSNSSASSMPSTPTSLRSRSPSISSLETIPDIPDAEAAASEADQVAAVKAAADRADEADASGGTRRRGTSDASGPTGSPLGVRFGGYGARADKRKRWSVCGAERRQDLDLETIWED